MRLRDERLEQALLNLAEKEAKLEELNADHFESIDYEDSLEELCTDMFDEDLDRLTFAKRWEPKMMKLQKQLAELQKLLDSIGDCALESFQTAENTLDYLEWEELRKTA